LTETDWEALIAFLQQCRQGQRFFAGSVNPLHQQLRSQRIPGSALDIRRAYRM